MIINTKHPDQWGWVGKYSGLENFTVSEEHVRQSYKLYQKPHFENASHGSINCKSNIACLKHLGESKYSGECNESQPMAKKKKYG